MMMYRFAATVFLVALLFGGAAGASAESAGGVDGMMQKIQSMTADLGAVPPNLHEALKRTSGLSALSSYRDYSIQVQENVLTQEECAAILEEATRQEEGADSLVQHPVEKHRFQAKISVDDSIYNRFLIDESTKKQGDRVSFSFSEVEYETQDNVDHEEDRRWVLPLNRLDASTVPHQDCYGEAHEGVHTKGQLVVGDDTQVVLMFLNDNPHASFVYGETRVKAKCGTKLTFQGKNIHSTVISEGPPVHVLGPVTAKMAHHVHVLIPPCFTEDSLVKMADGSVRAISEVDIGDEVAKGGRVTAVMKFGGDFRMCRVDGSVAATPSHSILLPDTEEFISAHTKFSSPGDCDEVADVIYDIDTEHHVIEFEGGVVATDYNEHEPIPEWVELEREMAVSRAAEVTEMLNYPDDSLFVYNVDFAGETLVRMEDSSYKKIKDIELGDKVSLGGKVLGIFQIDGSNEERLCRIAPNVVVDAEFLIFRNGAFEEGDYDGTCFEKSESIMYHLDTETFLIELANHVFSVSYNEHATLPEFTEAELKMTKELLKVVKAEM